MDDAMAIDEAASVFTSPRCKVESFFRMKDLAGDVGVDVGVVVAGVVERDFSRKRSMEYDWGWMGWRAVDALDRSKRRIGSRLRAADRFLPGHRDKIPQDPLYSRGTILVNLISSTYITKPLLTTTR